MKWIKGYQLFKESKTYSSKNIISEICVAMVLLNNEFLDNIIDRGQKARYSENSQIFLTDLKNLLLSKNRLHLGKFVDGKCESDDEASKINGYFNEVDFDIEKDWTKLVNCRVTARNIIDKLLPDEKLTPDRIRKIYWIGPNKDDEFNEDIVIETVDGVQYSLFLDRNLTLQKSSSFNTFAEDLIGEDINKMFSEENISKWDKLTQEFIRITYECSNKNIQQHIEKFIDPKRIDSINYFDYFSIRHRDPRFKHLGEFMKEFDKNILKLSDLLNEIWKKKEMHFSNLERADKEWTESKIVILNSQILENILTTSLKSDKADEIIKLEDGFKKGEGTIKMKLIKTLVEKMGCKERTLYYLSNNGNNFYQIPSREFFRKHYDDIDLHFDYHVKFKIKEDIEESGKNDFNIKVKLILNEEELISMDILVLFSGGEFSSKLTAKHRFNLTPDFNYKVSKILKVGEE
jgi:L-rhamnose mutarotase